MATGKKLTPDEPILSLDGLSVGNFWSWAYSDILSNTNRSIFAEFLVGAALRVLDKPRIEWNGYDLDYQGKKIEVKASAFLQSWPQNKPSTIIFDICPKRAWDASTAQSSDAPVRIADCYVFCLYAETSPQNINVLDVSKWEFYIVSSDCINQTFGDQKSIGLSSLRKISALVHHSQIRAALNQALGLADK